MFRNPWLVALFAGMTLVGVAALVGSEDHEGALSSVADNRDEARLAEAPMPAAAVAPPQDDIEAPVAETTEFADDSDLIDSGEGSDPTPEDPAAATADEGAPDDGSANVDVDPDAGDPGAD
ncbi:MAG: hypothetical protein ACTHK5_12985 [Tsuneonella sp.]